ncbi:MAG TPA: nicotinate phosphoribosyltransferase [Candidatus Nanoarchaeia archaeon]|nr:nicotinate phosphoribosyltransferase [Candidatus Nanoarchaeia archaeon]
MGNEKNSKTMLTDLYQLTMLAGYLDNNKHEETATFDLFIRKLPKDWGYYLANGIEDTIDYITNLKFSDEDLAYLRKQEFFKPEFLEYLKDFKFEGDVYAVREGTPVFPNQPVLRVTAKRSQAQFVETALLNMINYQTMIATKANRVVNAAKDAKVVDYGLRRAQEEDAAMKGARAAYIGGAIGTSNVKAGKEYGIKILGTQAHSFIMSFPTELEAFRAYVKTFPNKTTLLIDTYDTIEGAKNAAKVAKELEKQGDRLSAVRLDSGDLCDLSKKVRQILDEQGLHYVNIVASNDLNEYKIDELVKAKAPINGYGVGTEMITAKPVAAIPGVYKLVEDNDGAKIKLSQDKKTYPGKKQVYRVMGADGKYSHDILGLEYEGIAGTPLLEKVVKQGKRVTGRRNLDEIRQYALECVSKLPEHLKEVRVAQQYEMKISDGLNKLIDELTEKYGNGGERK